MKAFHPVHEKPILCATRDRKIPEGRVQRRMLRLRL